MNVRVGPALRTVCFCVVLTIAPLAPASAQSAVAAPTVPPPCSPVAPPRAPLSGRSAAIPGLPDRVAVPKEPHRYVYFPAREIYYAPETLQWFWQGGGRWNYGSNLPLGYGPEVGVAGISITLMTDRPYLEHADVVRRYGDKNHVKTAEERRAAEATAAP